MVSNGYDNEAKELYADREKGEKGGAGEEEGT